MLISFLCDPDDGDFLFVARLDDGCFGAVVWGGVYMRAIGRGFLMGWEGFAAEEDMIGGWRWLGYFPDVLECWICWMSCGPQL